MAERREVNPDLVSTPVRAQQRATARTAQDGRLVPRCCHYSAMPASFASSSVASAASASVGMVVIGSRP
jgi:hypothetical protein